MDGGDGAGNRDARSGTLSANSMDGGDGDGNRDARSVGPGT